MAVFEDTDYGSYEWFKCTSKWTGCNGGHTSIAELKTCFSWGYREAGGEKVWPCSWLLEGRYDDGSAYTYECGALSYEIEGGYTCERGHEHRDMQWMHEHGMAYASDTLEAAALTRRGVQCLMPDGSPYKS